MARELPPNEAPKPKRYIQWSSYDTGKPWVLEQGVDFDQDPAKAALAFRQWSYNHKRRVDVQVFEASIRIFIHPE